MSSASEKDDKGMHLNLHPYVLPPGVLLFCHLAQTSVQIVQVVSRLKHYSISTNLLVSVLV